MIPSDEALLAERRRLNQLADTFIDVDPTNGCRVFDRLAEIDNELAERADGAWSGSKR